MKIQQSITVAGGEPTDKKTARPNCRNQFVAPGKMCWFLGGRRPRKYSIFVFEYFFETFFMIKRFWCKIHIYLKFQRLNNTSCQLLRVLPPCGCLLIFGQIFLSPSGDLGIGLVWDNHPDQTTFRPDCWNPLQTELNHLWWVLSCS